MASSSHILALNIGTQSISLANFRPTATNGLELNGYLTREIQATNPTDLTRNYEVREATREMMKAMGIKSGKVNYAVTAQSVFTRFMKLPSVEAEKVDQIIQFEAAQNVPFPIEEVVWDYQLVSGSKDDQIEVVLVAIKSDLLNDINDSIEQSGLKTGVVDVAPMALYNAFRYNYSDQSGCSLIVDIGSKTTNLIFTEPGKVFSRSIPVGGSTITQAAAKELEMDAAEVERLKREKGFVGLGGAYADPDDPALAKLSKIIRTTMTRLHAEITRSISFYRAQQGGSQPVRVFLCGGSATLPYMREFFHEKLQLPIEYFNPLRNVAVTSNVNAEEISRSAYTMGEVVGLALREMHNCPMEVSLVPPSVIQKRKVDAKKPALIAAGICLLALPAGWWFYFHKATDVKQEALQALTSEVNTLKGFDSNIKKVNGEIDGLKKLVAPFTDVVVQRQYWPELIQELHEQLPERYIWITKLELLTGVDGKQETVTGALLDKLQTSSAKATTTKAPSRAKKDAIADEAVAGKEGVGDKIRITGLYLDNPRTTAVVQNFVQKLKESEFFENVENPRTTQPDNSAWAFSFEINADLKKPLPLK